MKLPIYLDYNATTPVAPEVADAIGPFLRAHFGNPSSTHIYGRPAHDAVECARAHVAALVGATASEIVFTGCATEANNLAILGVAQALRTKRKHVIVSAIEHPAVMQPCLRLEREGWNVTVLPVDGDARVHLGALACALRDDTVLVTVMHANNEVGTLQAIAKIANMAHARGDRFAPSPRTGHGKRSDKACRRKSPEVDPHQPIPNTPVGHLNFLSFALSQTY